MLIGSLFSGGGGGDHGLKSAGHEITFGCEIDKHSRAVLRYNNTDLPVYRNVNDITRQRLETDGIRFPDLIVGGSPCQDLSIAGKRAGLDGKRSGLFHEQCRIADELECKWVLWENVRGSLSSNKGEDFAEVIYGLSGYRPSVPKGGWRNSGVAIGPKRAIAWRVLDSFYFGVPQRRRRVFVVAGPRAMARRVAEVLLESESNSGNVAPNPQSRQGRHAPTSTAYTASNHSTRNPPIAFNHQTGGDVRLEPSEERVSTLTVGQVPAVLVEDDWGPVLRKLTPMECERLMAWPDNYTENGITDEGDLYRIANTHRYRICGNGMVASVTEWIGGRLP